MNFGAMNNPEKGVLEEIAGIAGRGFDYVDLTLEPPGAYEVDLEAVGEALGRLRLKAVGHTNPFLPAVFPLPRVRKACLEEFQGYLSAFKALSIDRVNVHPFTYAPRLSEEEQVQENIRFLESLSCLCRRGGFTLMLENGWPLGTPDRFEEALNHVPSLALTLDVGHANLGGKGNLAAGFFDRFPDRVRHVHLSDNWGVRDDHLPLGCGNIDWGMVARMLVRHGYGGTVTLEVFSPDPAYLVYSREKIQRLLEAS